MKNSNNLGLRMILTTIVYICYSYFVFGITDIISIIFNKNNKYLKNQNRLMIISVNFKTDAGEDNVIMIDRENFHCINSLGKYMYLLFFFQIGVN